MAQDLIISISGMRGLIGQNLFPGTAVSYGCAFGTFLKRQNPSTGKIAVAIGRDSRPSGQMLFSAVAAGLASAGIDVIDLGIVSTPGVGIMLRRLCCNGGIVITASHNPVEYNGIKLLLSNGIAPSPESARAIKDIYLAGDFQFADSLRCGRVSTDQSTNSIHIDKVLAIVDPDSIRARSFTVVLDSVNGAGGPVALEMLGRLGCKVIAVNTEPTGVFAHTPEPTRENLTGLCEQVRNASADIGFAQDPDADRLAIVDSDGTYIGEEYTLALAAKYIFAHNTGLAAANLSTSRMIDDIASAAMGSVIRTPVGEAHVAQAMIANGCVIGGEGNGGVIDLRIGPIRDSLVAMAMVLQLLAESGRSLSELVAEIPSYHMTKTKFPADSALAARIIETFGELFPNARMDTSDGCRLDLDDGWVHLRTSNTEPIMRAIVETTSPGATQKYIDTIEDIRAEAS